VTFLRRLRTMIMAILSIAATPISVVRAPLPPEIASLDPSDVDPNLIWAEVQIPGELGNMPAWWVLAEDKIPDELRMDRHFAILIHGRGGTRVGLLDMIRPLHDAGFDVLIISHRNDLEAPSSPDGFDHLGATEWRDLEAAVKWAFERGGDKFTLFARSAGAAIVGQFLSWSDEADEVEQVVLDNPVLDWTAVFLAAKPDWMPKWLGRLIIWGCARKIGVRMAQFDLAARPPRYRPRTLIIHAVDDDVCPIEMTDRLELATTAYLSNRPSIRKPFPWKGLEVYPTIGGHAGGRFEDENYLPVVMEFLTEKTPGYLRHEAMKEAGT
jgi:uncharacterized protein